MVRKRDIERLEERIQQLGGELNDLRWASSYPSNMLSGVEIMERFHELYEHLNVSRETSSQLTKPREENAP